MFKTIKELRATIVQLKNHNQIHNYIDFIQFPYYRNVEINTRVDFDFPLTVFIGQNGCGKSSALHALWGSTYGNTPYRFWFDTKIDPIEYYDDEKRRHSFWYSFRDVQGNQKEVVKARIKRNNDPNYWETSRPLTWAGMNSEYRSAPLRKKTIYIDFRSELSAFDKFFYFGNVKNLKSKNSQEYIRRKSWVLKKIFDGSKKKYLGVDKPLNVIDEECLKIISYILGKTYIEAKSILHRLFGFEGYSVIFKTEFANYSEAFAGSGEVAVFRLVSEVIRAPMYSLILLDEPEVSLHPGAQERLKIFLLDQIVKKKHQIILTSHSPSIASGLPKEALKVFIQNPNTGKFTIKQDLLPEEAFFHIEHKIDNKINITVEDRLAQTIIESVLNGIGPEAINLFNIKFYPGGETDIKKAYITVYSMNQQSKEFIVFDGDQKPLQEHLNWRNFEVNEIENYTLLKTRLENQVGCEIQFYIDGNNSVGGNSEQKIDLAKKYLDYYLTNVFYLPKNIPEEIIWNDEKASQLLEISDPSIVNQAINEINATLNYKKKFSILSKYSYGKNTSDDIFNTQKIFTQSWKNEKNEDYIYMEKMIRDIMNKISE